MRKKSFDFACKTIDIIKIKSIVIPIIFSVFSLTSLHAQQATVATGGSASGSGGTASYSVGQTVYTTNIGSNGSSMQGVQQAFEISIVSGIDYFEITLQCIAFPNPTLHNLLLRIDELDLKSKLTASLFDVHGKLLSQQEITGIETTIEMEQYPAQLYFLKILKRDKEIKTFKIIKQ